MVTPGELQRQIQKVYDVALLWHRARFALYRAEVEAWEDVRGQVEEGSRLIAVEKEQIVRGQTLKLLEQVSKYWLEYGHELRMYRLLLTLYQGARGISTGPDPEDPDETGREGDR